MKKNGIETFGQCLGEVLRTRSMRMTDLGAVLGLKSVTTLARALHDEAGPKSARALCDKILALDGLCLTPEERARLTASLEVSRLGADTYGAYGAMRAFLGDPVAEMSDIAFACFGECPPGSRMRLTEWLAEIAPAETVDILMINCCRPGFARTLWEGFRQSGDESVRILHYVLTDRDAQRTVEMLSALRPLMFHRCYEGYTIDRNALPEHVGGILTGDMLVARAKSGAARCGYLFSLSEDGTGQLFLPGPESALFDGMRAALAPLDGLRRQLTTAYPVAHTSEDYVNLTEQCRKLEWNRALRSIKPDCCICQIPSEIVESALIGGCSGVEPTDSLVALLNQLRTIHTRRFENVYLRGNDVQWAVTRAGLERLARTGRQSDHFWGMRPYTREERIRIFTLWREQLRINPRHRMYLLKEEYAKFDFSMMAYGNTCVEVYDAFTDFDLEQGYTDAVVLQKDFVRLFQEFYDNELVKSMTLPLSETAALLDALIAELKG